MFQKSVVRSKRVYVLRARWACERMKRQLKTLQNYGYDYQLPADRLHTTLLLNISHFFPPPRGRLTLVSNRKNSSMNGV
jgi:hypothetical protein